MQPTAKQPTNSSQPKVSHKPSITGIIFAVLSLVSSGIANFSVYAKYTPTGPTTGSVDREVGHAIGIGTTTVLGAIFGMPFIIGGLLFGALAIIFIALRLRKVRVGGYIFSAIAVCLVVWSVSIALGALDHISADKVV